jgi:CRP-like cAMP-binding protein
VANWWLRDPAALPPLESALPENTAHPLTLMLRKLEQRHPLTPEERAEVLALPFTRRQLNAHDHIVWEGDRPQHTCLLLSGFAFRHKVAGNGGRQIMSIHMKGDLVDLQNSMLGVADHNVQMLSHGEVALIPCETVRELAHRRPNIGMAMWYETLIEASIFREWILNIGRRDAHTRIGHLLCEFAMRLEIAELGNQTDYELPITQEQLADAVSLTAVHVNRTLKSLEKDGYISRTKRRITIDDWQKLARVADFQPQYLHIQAT